MDTRTADAQLWWDELSHRVPPAGWMQGDSRCMHALPCSSHRWYWLFVWRQLKGRILLLGILGDDFRLGVIQGVRCGGVTASAAWFA